MAKARGSKKVWGSEFKVQLYFSSLRLHVLPILKRIEVGDYPAKIGRIYGWSRSHVQYYVKLLQKAGLIVREKRTSAVFYEPTCRRSNFLGDRSIAEKYFCLNELTNSFTSG